LPQLEPAFAVALPPLIDLREIEERRRAIEWDGAVRSTFPGLSVKIRPDLPPVGTINRIKLGAGELFVIDSAAAEVNYQPPLLLAGSPPPLSLMVQREGSTVVVQGEHRCELSEGDMCLIDEASAFRLVGEDCSGILFLRLPRNAVLSRYPQLERLFARVLSSDDPGTKLLADTLRRLPAETPCLAETQRSAMMGAIIQLLGIAGPFSALPETTDWRVCRALDFIELNLSVAGLTAEDVARDQRISRRRLDQIMTDALGHSIASHLWSRRLEQAAIDLRDPRRSGSSVAQIAFANGFEDAAHFTRAFKRRYSVTPGQWRLN